jgi:hypothetical protein
MALPALDATFASAADLPRKQMLAKWLAEELDAGTVDDYYSLPEKQLWARIGASVGNKTEADYLGLPNRYIWRDIYNAVSGSNLGTIDWSEKQALGHIAAAYRGDTGNPANLATYIDWPWRYQVASIITQLASDEFEPEPNGNGEPATFNAVIVSGAGTESSNGTYTLDGQENGKNKYVSGSNIVYWDGTIYWFLYDDAMERVTYLSEEDVEFPWQGTWIIEDADEPPPTLTPTNV